jgi:poly-gamma-glutamate synthesis protein (capsule biosynthesis protein)
MVPLFLKADLAYANIEGPVAGAVTTKNKLGTDPGRKFDDSCYTGYPRFNYHPTVIDELAASGIDVVSTANNHSMDRGVIGVDRTIDHLRAAKLAFTGTRKSGDTVSPWHVITKAKGFKVAWVACTFSTNGISDVKHQVLQCFKDRQELLKIVSDLSTFPGIDAVIVTPHWGDEYENEPDSDQKKLARELIESGAVAVIGSHPHVLQPWEKHVAHDGREGFIIYSLGNFVSAQRSLAKRTSVVLYLGLTRDENGRTHVNGARFVPVAMEFESKLLTLFPATKKGPLKASYKHAISQLNEAQAIGAIEPLLTNPACH